MSNKSYFEYRKSVDDLLEALNVKFEASDMGHSCPPFCNDKNKPNPKSFPRKTHIHGKHYQCIFSRDNKTFAVDFWESYAMAQSNALALTGRGRVQLPDAYTVLSCCQLNDPGSFDDWCGDFGYDTDSRKAYSTYNLCVKEYKNAISFFTQDEIEKILELAN